MKKTMIFALLMLTGTAGSYAQVTIGSDNMPKKGALLDLNTQAPNEKNATTDQGGLLLPRVELVSRYTLEPFIANDKVTAEDKKNLVGLRVYNVTDNVAADLIPGLYLWNGEVWETTITQLPPLANSRLNVRDLQTKTASTVGDSYGNGGSLLDFGVLTMPEDGSYAFNFRLYGTVGATAVPQGIAYYLTLWVDGVLADAVEINMYAPLPVAFSNTYSVALGCTITAGQTITVKLSHNALTPHPWNLEANPGVFADRTSMIWWKL